jgi:hypothetical protein
VLQTDITGNFSDKMVYANANVLNQWWIIDGDVSAGVRHQYDFTKKETSAARVEAQYTINKTQAVWGHFNIQNKFAALAFDNCMDMAGVQFKNTLMLTYMHGNKACFMNTPVGFRVGSECQLSKEMKVVSNWGYSTRAWFNANMNATMKKNFNVGVHIHFDDDREAEKKIECGLELHYKCDDLLGDY